MYASHFGLTQDPFSIAPDPHYLFMSERHREALAHLLYGIGGGGGFVLLSGEIGTGKTTVCRCFLEQIPANCNVAYIFNPKLTVRELLKSICDEFHIRLRPNPISAHATSAKELTDALNEFLLATHTAGKNNVLIIDEAQNLSADVLEQLRLLTNLETNERKLLQIVLIGQPELRRMVARPELEQLAQRVIARYHLEALTPRETAQYIQHRLGVAGLKGAMPFSPRALQRVQQLSRGVPRRINLLCARAMLGAYATGQANVNLDVLDKAATEVFGPPVSAARPALSASRKLWFASLGSVLVGAAAVAAVWWGLEASRATPSVTRAAAVGAPTTRALTHTPSQSISPIATQALPVVAPLPAFMRDEAQAWRSLAALWKLDAGDAGNACELALAQQLQCFRVSNSTLALIRQLNRPGLLTLVDANGQSQQALLTGLTQQTATLGQGTGQQTLPLAELARSWRGDFSTVWQLPPSYTGLVKSGDSSPPVQWLAARLAALDGLPQPNTPQTLNDALRERIQTFQRAQGLPADGQAGPMTLMQLGRATGLDEPRLRTDTGY
jgi:general secretion pathway protein A